MSDTRSYRSPLREEQARQTRERVLDAFVGLLAERRSDDITTREIAERARVSQPTVYRHFPDRDALLAGISARIGERSTTLTQLSQEHPSGLAGIDDIGPLFQILFAASDEFAVEVTAEALMNADPRHYSPETRRHSERILEVVAADLPDLDARQHARVAALVRCLASSQAWLRMREEYGVPGVESGPLVRWAIDVLVAAVRDGELPEIDTAAPEEGNPP